jgi:hypothetical protein
VENFKPLAEFFEAISKDGRISIAHIGLYAVLLHCWQSQEFKNPVVAYSHELMFLAKISTRVTLLKCLYDLNDRGYIRYEPSLKRNMRSKIFLVT